MGIAFNHYQTDDQTAGSEEQGKATLIPVFLDKFDIYTFYPLIIHKMIRSS